jgi:hypothetical protein
MGLLAAIVAHESTPEGLHSIDSASTDAFTTNAFGTYINMPARARSKVSS